MKKKIGIMGGTFNPIHIGHLFLAEQALEQYQLSQVIFLPSKHPPHKDNSKIIADYHRKNMIELAIENNSYFLCSTLELERHGTTYTIDTMKQLIEKNPEVEYYFIIGADSLYQLDTWKNIDELFQITNFLVAVRDGISWNELKRKSDAYKEKYHGNIYFLNTPNLSISSSEIRKRCSLAQSIRYYVPDNVRNYILKTCLYTDN